MPTNHEVVAALPVGLDVEKDLLRDCIVRRVPYSLAADEDAQQLVAEDPDSGAVILVLSQNGRLFALDPLDSTTLHDGTTCLVSNDNYRYKLDDLNVPRAVLDKDLTEPPADPAIGDAYLLYGSPTGDWAEFASGQVVVFTSRGWEAITLPIGALTYVEDEDAFYHLDTNGDWQEGFGINALPDASIAPRKMIGSVGWLHPIVENQTTNAPPTSPVPAKGTAYIIGSSPTGAWAGNAGKVAVYEDDEGTYEIYTPQEGWRVYDKSLDIDYRFDGSAWVSQSGTIIKSDRVTAATSALSTAGSGAFTWDPVNPPTTALSHSLFATTIDITAPSGKRIDIDAMFVANNTISVVFAIFRDNETTPLDYMIIDAVDNRQHRAPFRITANDSAQHTYKLRAISLSGGIGFTTTVDRMSLEYRVYA